MIKTFFSKNGALIYVFEGKMPEEYEFNTSNDPDLEVEEWSFVDPIEVADELNIPLEENEIIKYWAYN